MSKEWMVYNSVSSFDLKQTPLTKHNSFQSYPRDKGGTHVSLFLCHIRAMKLL